MANDTSTERLGTLVRKGEARILQSWMDHQISAPGYRNDRLNPQQLADESRRFLSLFGGALQASADIHSPDWATARQMLDELSASRAEQGFTPTETARFVFSLKQAIFERIREELGSDPGPLADITWTASTILDKLGLHTAEAFQRSREQIIVRQQHEMMELSTPVVTLWQDVLALPLIGTLDSARTQVVMENLLQRIVDTGARIAIIDITGVPIVDTLTAQHLLKTIAAARLMGAECIISGIRPQIAQTIVHLGVDLGTVVTKATLADAFAVALRGLGLRVTRRATSAPGRHPPPPSAAPDGGGED